MLLDRADYLASVNDYERQGMLLDQTLYRLCDEYPLHGDSGAVNAKLCLIGRAFATGVERHIKSSGTQGSSLGKMAKHLLQHGDKVDALVQQVRQLTEPLDVGKLSTVVAVHGRFCKLVSQIAHRDMALVSFASKYLHLHAPIVPIFDGWVSKQARRMYRKHDFRSFQKPRGANSDFYEYCLCFWQLYSGLRAVTTRVSVRRAERYLLWLSSSKREKRLRG